MTHSDQTLSAYRAKLKMRDAHDRRQAHLRARDARRVADDASDVLKKTYGASHVWLFGSVAERGWITPHSDIDLAVEGMAPIAHLEAVAFLEAFHPSFSFDLIHIDHCRATLRDAIKKQGVLL